MPDLEQPATLPLTLLLGGVRAGKSARAVALAAQLAAERRGTVLFVATAQPFDDEMRRRITAHQRERPADWETLESPLELADDLVAQLDAGPDRFAAVVVDCLTVWVSNLLLTLRDDDDAEAAVAGRLARLLALCARQSSSRHDGHGESTGPRWIVVSNEVGLGVVPPTVLGRRYRDALGRANQIVAAAADEVILMVAGLELRLKPQ